MFCTTAGSSLLDDMHGLNSCCLLSVCWALQEIQEDLSQVQQQMSRLSAERLLEAQALVGPADTATGEAGAAAAGPAGPGGLTAATAAIIAADAAVTQEQALSGLQGVVQTWQQELVSFKQVRGGGVEGD